MTAHGGRVPYGNHAIADLGNLWINDDLNLTKDDDNPDPGRFSIACYAPPLGQSGFAGYL